MHADHSVAMFRGKFWGTLLLSIPNVVWAMTIQHWFFAVADAVRQESREAVQRLHEQGIAVIIMTGDARSVANAVGKGLIALFNNVPAVPIPVSEEKVAEQT